MTHSEMVSKLAKRGTDMREAITAGKCAKLFAAIGVSKEAGELLDAVNRHALHGKELDRNNVIEELGDIEFYLECMRAQVEVTREEVLEHNAAKLSKRYPNLNYSDTAYHARADKQNEPCPENRSGKHKYIGVVGQELVSCYWCGQPKPQS